MKKPYCGRNQNQCVLMEAIPPLLSSWRALRLLHDDTVPKNVRAALHVLERRLEKVASALSDCQDVR